MLATPIANSCSQYTLNIRIILFNVCNSDVRH